MNELIVYCVPKGNDGWLIQIMRTRLGTAGSQIDEIRERLIEAGCDAGSVADAEVKGDFYRLAVRTSIHLPDKLRELGYQVRDRT